MIVGGCGIESYDQPLVHHGVELFEEGGVWLLVGVPECIEVDKDIILPNHRLHHMDEIRYCLGNTTQCISC